MSSGKVLRSSGDDEANIHSHGGLEKVGGNTNPANPVDSSKAGKSRSEGADLRSTAHFLVTQLTEAPASHACDLIVSIVMRHPSEPRPSLPQMCT